MYRRVPKVGFTNPYILSIGLIVKSFHALRPIAFR